MRSQQSNMDNPYGRSNENGNWSKNPSREADEEQLNADRQQRKIIAAFLDEENGHPNYSILNQFEAPPMPMGGRDIFLDRLAKGQITPENEKELLNMIKSPIDRDGVELVKKSLQSKHELRILGQMTRGDEGFSNWYNLNQDDLANFLAKYPLPMDFEDDSARLLSDIGSNNSREKRLEYEQAMRDFKKKIYGKRQEYWERLKELHREADIRQRSNPNTNRSPNPLQRLGNKIMELVAWLPGSHAEAQISKYILTGGILRPGEKDPCQDSMFADSRTGIYGVFDGVGGAVNGSRASQAAARAIAEWSTVPQLSEAYCSGRYLAEVLDWVNDRVCREGGGGQTTASLVKIGKIDGKKYLSFAQVGDSRIYIVNKYGEARMITKDEGFRNRITNSLGASYGKTCKQYNEDSIWLEPGDRVVVCSDGITGDRQPDLMSDETIGAIVSKAKSPRQACEELLRRATKIDDRSVIVFAP